jgi:DNA-directed RNA polymerase specialized sigma subunit
VAALSEYVVRATPWAHGWELDIPGVGVTQSRNLREAEAMVRDYLNLDMGEVEATNADVKTVPVIKGRDIDIEKVKALQERAEAVQRSAATATRELAAKLRKAGASGADIARLLGVSAQRVSQLLKDADRTRL